MSPKCFSLIFSFKFRHLITQKQYTKLLLKETKTKQRRKLIIKTPPFLSLYVQITTDTCSAPSLIDMQETMMNDWKEQVVAPVKSPSQTPSHITDYCLAY